MSSLLFAGVFSLHGGRRAQTSYNKRNGEKGSAWHAYYKTAVICQAPPLLPAEVRVYSRAQDVLYLDHTVALIFAKAFVLPANVGGEILLDAMHVAAFPGNPMTDNYDESLPDFHWPLVFAGGTVSTRPVELPNQHVVFTISVVEYVRGTPQQSTIE
jgi:hypothetical protein